MFPPIVARFWIWAAPTVAAASTRAGASSRQRADRRMSANVVRAPMTSARRLHGDAPQLVEPPQVEAGRRRRTELAGQLDEEVGRPGDRSERLLGIGGREERIGLGQGLRRGDRRFDAHPGAPSAEAAADVAESRRSAASAIASTIFV